MNSTIDLIAKLLATENLTVVKAAVRTASFDIGSRQLTLPILKNMTDNIEGMLVGHEVGHALYTTMDMLDASKDNRKLHSYINVLEDIRIEKLMKRKYPGLRKTMIAGYNELNERDFFDIGKVKNRNKLLLIDRINLWYKVGLSANIKFSNTEKKFLNRAEKTETPDEVIELAKEIFQYSKEQKENEQQEDNYDEFDEDFIYVDVDFEEDMDGTDEYDELEENEGKPSNSNQESKSDSSNKEAGTSGVTRDLNKQNDDGLESITDSAFSKSLEELADTSFNYVYHTLFDEYTDKIIPYKTILAETADAENEPYRYSFEAPVEPLNVRFNKFKTDTSRSVSYLVKEFEMKKAATSYKRATISKSGSLDMKKIWGYQLNDDLFKRITTIADGKNHGMIFLLDWSSSMSSVLADTIQQLIQLATFCHRVQIPFQVLAFTSSYRNSYDDNDLGIIQKERAMVSRASGIEKTVITGGQWTLMEFFNHKMSNQEFNTMARRLYNSTMFVQCPRFSLGSTPLNEALAFMTEYVGKFIAKNNVEKMSFITLTDGAGSSLSSSYGLYATRTKNFLTDRITKKSYLFSSNGTEQTNVLLKMIKDRYDCSVLGFYLIGKLTPNELRSAYFYTGSQLITIDDAKEELKSNGYVALNAPGYDELMVIPGNKLKIDDSEIEVSSKQSAKVIARNLTKVMNGRQVNRVLLNKFISVIA